ncbi:MAG: leucine-rich repeat domain-containing protein [Clostridiales bacterium]|nr:leucine-rich repeat domain-containing protein [Clostridiales bacterium]
MSNDTIFVRFTVSKEGVLKKCDRDLGWVRFVAVPESVVRIGQYAMRNFGCITLVMPSTLKVIERYAFKDAFINNVDFKDCKLERIEDGAFERCVTKTELPDTVEYIGSECDLRIAKENKIKLPKALKYISTTSINLDDVYEVEVQEGMIRLDSNLVFWLDFQIPYKDWVVLRVFRDGKELYRFVHNERWRVDTNEYNYMGPQGIIYDHYDLHFDDTSSMHCKALMAAYRLVWPTDLPEEIEKKYRTYVKHNFSGLIQGKEEDIESIRLFCNAGLLTPFRLKQLLENASKKNNTELVAYLVEEIRKSGSKSKSLKL